MPSPRRNIGALPAHLPRCEQVIEPASTLCPCCSAQMHRIGEETSEALDRVPAWLRVLRTIRPKYACRGCEGPIVQAPAPARLVEGGMATTALIAHIAMAKEAWSWRGIGARTPCSACNGTAQVEPEGDFARAYAFVLWLVLKYL